MADDRERRTLDLRLGEARERIRRLTPEDAEGAIRAGALLVDVRAENNRERDGIVPGSLHIPLTVLEWRVDPDSEWRSPYVGGLDQELILICDHGCSTILAASSLVDLGFTRVGDVVGGFLAWREAGLPVSAATLRERAAGEPEGMSPPDE